MRWLSSIIFALAVLSSASTMATMAINPEAKALSSSGWRLWSPQYGGDHCTWPGIICGGINGTGRHVVGIKLDGGYPLPGGLLSDVNWIDLPHLTRIHVTGDFSTEYLNGKGLSGSLPQKICVLSELTYLNLSCNFLTGVLPSSFANLTKLETLDLSTNLLGGSIQPELFVGLVTLDLSNNYFNGPIPSTIGQLKSLERLSLGGNHIEGPIPSTIGNLTNLHSLDLSANRLQGQFPIELLELPNLQYLYLSYNNLSGHIPSPNTTHNGSWANLHYLYLRENHFSGRIPFGIENLPQIREIDLSWNNISGDTPSDFGAGVSGNYLTVNLSHNNLSGAVPNSICNLYSIDLTFNPNLEGQVPLRVVCKFRENIWTGNYKLGYNYFSCDLNIPIYHHKQKKHYYFLVAALVLAFSLLFGGYHFLARVRTRRIIQLNTLDDSPHGDIFRVWNFNGNIAYEDIINATDDFDIRHCIGTGRYGSVYRAILPGGKIVALKKLHSFEGEDPVFDRCFRNEAEVLSRIRHRNIVKLFGFCLHKRCMFLIYDYMERGSLFGVLRYDDEAEGFEWMKRVNVVKGIAHALSYLHHDCDPPILHRDVSSNNVLLDSKLEACLSDFGTARLLGPDSSNRTLVVGTRGYIAPGIHQSNSISVNFSQTSLNILGPNILNVPFFSFFFF